MNFLGWVRTALIVTVLAFVTTPAFAGVFVSIDIAPPPLPDYVQPPCPDDGYIWTPGYWAYGDYGYYWVPGTWVQPPEFGLFWTPYWWGWDGGVYALHSGYWGPHVGFYGGINYGYGYGGNGYYGGRWQGHHFFYNTAVNRVDGARIHNTYEDKTVIINNSNHTSFNGGAGGLQAQATDQEKQYASQHHISPTVTQVMHSKAAALDRGQLASVNGGKPATLAAATPSSYKKVALKHVAATPLTRQDKVKAPGVTPEKNATMSGSEPNIPEEKKIAVSEPKKHVAETKAPAEKSHHKATVTAQPHIVEHHTQPAFHSQPQFHSVQHAQPPQAPRGGGGGGGGRPEKKP